MLAIPAIDLRDAHCVQLVGGDYSKEAVRLDDPVGVARRWSAAGFSRLHVVDLDAATGRGENREVVLELLRAPRAAVQVGGGVREAADMERWLDEGAEWVVIGTRGVEDPDWLAEQAELAPGRLVLAADVRERQVVTRGWATTNRRTVHVLISELEGVPLGAILVTAVHKEGKALGAGSTSAEVPGDATSVVALDVKRGVKTVVALDDDVADYAKAPRGKLDLRAFPFAEAFLGSEGLGLTPLPPISAVAGSYKIRFVYKGREEVRTVVLGRDRIERVVVDFR